MPRPVAAGLLLVALAMAQDVTVRTRVPLVVAPTTVTDRNGRYVDGLTADDFVLLDAGKPQRFEMDTSDIALTPLSVVIAVQTNEYAAAALAKIRKTGSLVEPLITGEHGEAAVVTFSEELRVAQEFTSDGACIETAFSQLRPHSRGQARMLDAVSRGIDMLRLRPQSRRRVLLLMGETRDRGSEAKLNAVLLAAQRADVTVYPVTFSAHATPWTSKPQDTPPPAEGPNLIGVFKELGRLGKTNTAEALGKFTGGRRVSFVTLKKLERDLADIGEELHSQYLISFTPAVARDEKYHTIAVQVKNRPDVVVRTRPGYWAER